jgi:hypothetical protein
MAGQAVDGGEMVGIEAVLGAEDKHQGKQGNPLVGQFHGGGLWR